MLTLLANEGEQAMLAFVRDYVIPDRPYPPLADKTEEKSAAEAEKSRKSRKSRKKQLTTAEKRSILPSVGVDWSEVSTCSHPEHRS